MTPFDHNLHIHQDSEDPIGQDDLIAFHLHELPRQRVRAVHRALQTNPGLQAESMAIAVTLRAFPKHEAGLPLDAAALDRHWLALLPSLVAHLSAPSPRFRLLRQWSLPLLVGSALAATALLISLYPYRHDRDAQPHTTATVATHPPTTPTLSPSTSSNSALLPGAQSNAFNPHPQIINHARYSPSAPLPVPNETALAKNSPNVFPPESPAPLTPVAPSSGVTGSASTEATTPPLASPAPLQSPAQSSTQPNKSQPSSTPHHFPSTELTLGIFGDLTASRSSTYTNGTGTSTVTEPFTEYASPAIGALASFRQQLRPRLGYRLTTTYTSPTFDGFGRSNFRIYEFSGTYVVQGPHRRRFTTSAEAGASLLDFLSTDDYYPLPPFNSRILRGAGVVGVGTEFALTKHWGLRAEYRAMVYKPPVFSSTSGSPDPPSKLTFSSNPIVGITYRFGGKGDD